MFDIFVLKSSDISFYFDKPNMEPDLKQINIILINAVLWEELTGVHVVKDFKVNIDPCVVLGTRQHNMVRC